MACGYPSDHRTPFVAVLSVVDDGGSSLPVVSHQYYLLAVVHDDLNSYDPGAVSVDLAHCRSDRYVPSWLALAVAGQSSFRHDAVKTPREPEAAPYCSGYGRSASFTNGREYTRQMPIMGMYRWRLAVHKVPIRRWPTKIGYRPGKANNFIATITLLLQNRFLRTALNERPSCAVIEQAKYPEFLNLEILLNPCKTSSSAASKFLNFSEIFKPVFADYCCGFF